mgnify:CR=1 FL=1
MTQSTSRRELLRLAAAFPAIMKAAPRAPRPNIVVILADDMGFSDIGCFGSEIPTPNLDRLAARGIRFTHFSNTARCSPTRASLLTGLYPHQAGMGHLDNMVKPGSRGYQGRLSEESATIAEVLRPAGYRTIMTGKWHLGQQHGTPPWQRGFERSLNSQAGGIYFPGQVGRKNQPLYLNGRAIPLDSPELGNSWYSSDLWTKFGLNFIDEAVKEKKPFFHYLAFCAPHFPLMAPQADIDRFRGKYMAGWDRLREERYRRQIRMGLIDRRWPLTERPPDSPAWDSLDAKEKDRYDHMMAIYAAMVHRIDVNVGVLVEGLSRRGVLDDTLILFLSDNGGNAESGPSGRYTGNPPGGPDSNVFLGMNWATLNNTPFRRYKHFTHEGGISTPLVAHWPRGIARELGGTFERTPGHVIDIMPTAVELAGAEYPARLHGASILPMEGVSLAPAFAGGSLTRRQPLFYNHEGNRGIRAGKWKLVAKHADPWELYDMEADRTEMNNLAAARPDLARRLADDYDAWAGRTFAEPWEGPRRTDWGQEPPPEETAAQKKGGRKKAKKN